MKQLDVYEVLENADNIEGRGPMLHVAYFTHHIDANRASSGRGVMGVGDGDVKKKTLTIFESFAEYSDNVTEKLRKSALNKLSHEEKVALGLEK